MKLVGRIVSYIFLVIVALLSLVFAFVELRSLFAGDFTLFNFALFYKKSATLFRCEKGILDPWKS